VAGGSGEGSETVEVTRRDFLSLVAIAGGLGGVTPAALARALEPERLLDFEPLGNVTLLHMTDAHGSLLPVYYREPDARVGVGDEAGKPPFLSGEALLRTAGVARGSAEAYALTHLDFAALAARYGRMGGYAHIATLVRRVRAERPGKTLLLDGGDTLQGSATALWTRGEDMLRAMNQLGVEVFTPHWEFTYGIDRVRELFGDRETRGQFAGDFVCHNARELNWDDPVFAPYTIKALGGVRVGVIGQAFPYVPVSHPRRFVPGLTFGIQEDQAQKLVNELRDARKVDLVVLLSHNGFSTDVKMVGRVRGIDVVLGGHTHDALTEPAVVGRTLVVNSGAHGKFLSRLDLDVRDGRVRGHRYKLLPVLSRYIPEDPDMARLIRELRAPWERALNERLAVSESLLYRRGTFNGSFDEIVLDALMKRLGAEAAFSPGFRWGTTVVPGQDITLEDVYAHTGLSYPSCLVRELAGAEIHRIMEDVADNLFHPDPYYRQGGDMLRVGGISYAIDPRKPRGRRISELTLAGKPLAAERRYKVASWASPGPEVDGPAAYDVVADHLRSLGRVKLDPRPRVKLL
jgi:S-sulfosulfanyl-L-cysteine sulfohydrolase